MDAVEEPTKARYIPAAAFLLILTAGAYWLTFRYESAYFTALHLPISLIEVSKTSMLSTFFILSSLALTFFLLANIIAIKWPAHPLLQRKMLRSGVLILFIFWYAVANGFRKEDWYLYLIFFGILFVFDILPLLGKRDGATLKEKLIDAENRDSPDLYNKSLITRACDAFGPFCYFVFLFFWVSTSLVGISGDAKARTQEIYPISITDPAVAVIRMYGDKRICVRFDQKSKMVKSFFVKGTSEGHEEFENKRIGPLKVDDLPMTGRDGP